MFSAIFVSRELLYIDVNHWDWIDRLNIKFACSRFDQTHDSLTFGSSTFDLEIHVEQKTPIRDAPNLVLVEHCELCGGQRCDFALVSKASSQRASFNSRIWETILRLTISLKMMRGKATCSEAQILESR